MPDIVDGTYWPNDFEVQRGKEHLKAYLLREGMHSNRLTATCCHTILLVDHPFYEGKLCLCLDGEADDEHRYKIMKNYTVPPFACRVLMRDADPEARKRHPAEAVGVAPEMDFTGDEPNFVELITPVFDGFKDFTLTTKGQTFQEIAAECGPQLYMDMDSKPFAYGGDYQEDVMNRVIIGQTEAESAAAAKAAK